MASFDEHIRQAISNLKFLQETNSNSPTFWDWQVTIAYYVGVHIANAHLAQVADLHYRTHEAVKNALFAPLSISIVPQDIYLAYTKLENLSRRSRYLCHDNPENHAQTAHTTYDKHLAKAIRHLDKLLEYFKNRHGFACDKYKIKCSELSKADNLKNFEV